MKHAYQDPCGQPSCCPPEQLQLPSCKGWLMLAPRVIAATLSGSAQVIKRTFDGSWQDEDTCCTHKSDCCEIPETSCPSPCVGEVIWQACSGDRLHHLLKIRNTGNDSRKFKLAAQTFSCSNAQLDIKPSEKTLKPGEHFEAKLSFVVPDELAGGSYSSEVKILGRYEQVLCVHLCVHPRQACCTEVKQGEIPKRIKADHWYKHFQCEENCFEEITDSKADARKK